MPKRRQGPVVYTPAQRAAIVGEIQQRHRHESRSIEYLARQLGISDKTYYNWVRAGVRAPQSMPVEQPASTRLKAARRYDAAQRTNLMEEITRRHDVGQKLSEILRDVDLGRTTYARWLDEAAPAPTFRAVIVEPVPCVATSVALVAMTEAAPAPTPPGPALTLVAPGGYRIEGLAIESAAALLRALS